MPKKKTNSRKKRTTNKSTKSNNTRQTAENMKYEIASEFGVNLGASASSRDNGLVGGEMTKRLVEKGKKKNSTNTKSSKNK